MKWEGADELRTAGPEERVASNWSSRDDSARCTAIHPPEGIDGKLFRARKNSRRIVWRGVEFTWQYGAVVR